MIDLGHRLGWTPGQTMAATWWELTTALWSEIRHALPPEEAPDSHQVKAFFRNKIGVVSDA